jgi:hypothetical protein
MKVCLTMSTLPSEVFTSRVRLVCLAGRLGTRKTGTDCPAFRQARSIRLMSALCGVLPPVLQRHAVEEAVPKAKGVGSVRSAQGGFGALSLIVFTLVVALTLSVLITNSRMSTPIGDSKARLLASALIEQGESLVTAFSMADAEAKLRGGALTFDGGTLGMFNPSLTGISRPSPPRDAVSNKSTYWSLQFDLDLGLGTSTTDIFFLLHSVRSDVCSQINLLLLGSDFVPSSSESSDVLMYQGGYPFPVNLLWKREVPRRGCLQFSDGHVFYVAADIM